MAEVWYNGYAPGETKVQKMRRYKRDKGHSIVEFRTTRRGHDFAFTYVAICECGKRFTSRQASVRNMYAWEQHLKKEGVRS